MSSTKAKLGCQNCRLRHLKCDDAEPACTKCQASGHECIRSFNVRFKHTAESSRSNIKPNASKFSWEPDQAWPRTTSSEALIFMDETESLTRVYESHAPLEEAKATFTSSSSQDEEPTAAQRSSVEFRQRSLSPASPTKRTKLTHAHKSYDSRVDSANPQSGQVSPPVTQNQESLGSRHMTTTHDHQTWSPNVIPKPPQLYNTRYLQSIAPLPVYSDQPAWPLDAVEEAKLMRYYVSHIANWFDVCDQRRHFATVLPQRAVFCPPLLCAIFTVAAYHMSLRGFLDPYIADRYHEKCLEHLKHIIHDQEAVVDENLFAAIVVLRFLEEVDDTDPDAQSHLIGIKALLSHHESLPTLRPPIGVRLACYWVAIRQELVISFMQQRRMQWNLARVPIDHTERTPADDDTWANRAVVLCAHVIDFAFDPEGDSRARRFRELTALVDSWMQQRPPSFEPLWFAPEGSPFVDPDEQVPLSPALSPSSSSQRTSPLPQQWHLSPVHVIARQHLLLAQILLTAHDPTIPRLGPAQKPRLAAADARIRGYVRLLAGLAVSNAGTPTNLKTACMGIQMAGECLVEEGERRAVMEVLVRAETEYRWPTERARRALRGAWGWSG